MLFVCPKAGAIYVFGNGDTIAQDDSKSVCLYLIISAKIYMKAPAPLIIAGIEILEKIGYIIPQYC